MLDNSGMLRYLGLSGVGFNARNKLQPTRIQSEEEMPWKRRTEEWS
jgi:hypothetical protein